MDMAFLTANRASTSLALAEMDVHDERGLSLRILPEIEAVDNCPLDMEEILQ